MCECGACLIECPCGDCCCPYCGCRNACEVGCLRGEGHDGECIDEDDVAEGKLRARDYDGWAAL
jgi:hypothetical protein